MTTIPIANLSAGVQSLSVSTGRAIAAALLLFAAAAIVGGLLAWSLAGVAAGLCMVMRKPATMSTRRRPRSP